MLSLRSEANTTQDVLLSSVSVDYSRKSLVKTKSMFPELSAPSGLWNFKQGEEGQSILAVTLEEQHFQATNIVRSSGKDARAFKCKHIAMYIFVT